MLSTNSDRLRINLIINTLIANAIIIVAAVLQTLAYISPILISIALSIMASTLLAVAIAIWVSVGLAAKGSTEGKVAK